MKLVLSSNSYVLMTMVNSRSSESSNMEAQKFRRQFTPKRSSSLPSGLPKENGPVTVHSEDARVVVRNEFKNSKLKMQHQIAWPLVVVIVTLAYAYRLTLLMVKELS